MLVMRGSTSMCVIYVGALSLVCVTMRKGACGAVAERLQIVGSQFNSRPTALIVTIALGIIAGTLILATMYTMTLACSSLINMVPGSPSTKRAAMIQAALIVLVPALRYGGIRK